MVDEATPGVMDEASGSGPGVFQSFDFIDVVWCVGRG